MRKLLCGKNLVLEAIANNLPIKIIYTNKPNKIHGYSNIKIVTKDFLDKMTNTNHQGYIAELMNYNYYNLSSIFIDKPKKILILDHIQDPHNFGSILRSSNAFGIKHIIIPKERAVQISDTVLKVSSGGYMGIKIIRVNSLIDSIIKLKKNNFWIYSSITKNSNDINQIKFNYPLAVIFGNEHKGVSRTLIKHSDQNFFIKTIGSVQSLNVAVATAITLSKI